MAKTDKRRRIMRAVEKLFERRDVRRITLDEIAHKARVGKGTLYLYFRDKDDLFFQTMASGFDELCEALDRKIPDDAPFPEQLLRACTEINTFFETRFPLFQMMQTEGARMYWSRPGVRRSWLERRKRLAAALAVVIRKGVREKGIRDDIPAETLARVLLGLLRTRGEDLREGAGSLGRYETIIDLFRHGAQPRKNKENV